MDFTLICRLLTEAYKEVSDLHLAYTCPPGSDEIYFRIFGRLITSIIENEAKISDIIAATSLLNPRKIWCARYQFLQMIQYLDECKLAVRVVSQDPEYEHEYEPLMELIEEQGEIMDQLMDWYKIDQTELIPTFSREKCRELDRLSRQLYREYVRTFDDI